MIEPPKVRPGKVLEADPSPRIVAFFRNSSQGNLAIQRLVGLGIPSDRLAVTPPDQIEGRQGMILSIPRPDSVPMDRIESLCRSLGAEVHHQRS
ncbi:hypothetical protein [Tautonia marina]|uniref:hypothetical protein n=1 Tax=Tautonia marina TaxID=2653855 RepID=UPI001F1ABB18|nr:hypothetical protein [Tautonia marina]